MVAYPARRVELFEYFYYRLGAHGLVTHERHDAPLQEQIMTKLLSKQQVREVVLYSLSHIDRLEKSGLFPKRVPLGPNRVGWVEDEIVEWLQTRIDNR